MSAQQTPEAFQSWLARRGRQAARQLWKLANAADTPESRRVQLLEFFIEMGVGKAKVMETQPTAFEGGGVVILPAAAPEEMEPHPAEFP